MQKLVGVVLSPQLLLPVGVVRVSLLLSLLAQRLMASRHIELDHFFLSSEINGFST